MDDISKHLLTKTCYSDYSDSFEQSLNVENEDEKILKGTKRRHYATNVCYLVSEVLYKITLIESTKDFIGYYPRKTKINRLDYTTYHLESYLANLTGTFDRCLMLTNCIFDLGLKPKEVRYQSIISNSKIKRHKICKTLKDFKNFLDEAYITYLRNRTMHRKSFDDEHVGELAKTEMLLMRAEENILRWKKRVELENKLNKNYISFVKFWNEGIDLFNKQVINATDRLFTDSFDKYIETRNNRPNKEIKDIYLDYVG